MALQQTAKLQTDLDYAGKLLDQLKDLDATVHGAYYDMGRILSAILHGKLYDALGYESMGQLIAEELSFSSSQGFRYLHTFRHFKRLGYSKNEALELISEFSFTHMAHYLPKAKDKVGKRAIKAAITKMLNESRQINFALSKSDLSLLIEALRLYGAEPKDGRLLYSSNALMEMVKEVLD
jgi:hypothetical protein